MKNNNLTQEISFLLVAPQWPVCLLTQERGGQAIACEAGSFPIQSTTRSAFCLFAPLSVLSGYYVNVYLICWVAPDHHITTESQQHQAFQNFKCISINVQLSLYLKNVSNKIQITIPERKSMKSLKCNTLI